MDLYADQQFGGRGLCVVLLRDAHGQHVLAGRQREGQRVVAAAAVGPSAHEGAQEAAVEEDVHAVAGGHVQRGGLGVPAAVGEERVEGGR